MRRTALFAGLLFWATAALAGGDTYTVQSIEDGDTLLIEWQGAPLRLQLAGIDAPEDTDNPKLARDLARTGLERDALLALGEDATAHLATLAAPGSEIAVEGDLSHKDRYGRTPVTLFDRRGRNLNEAMVGDGYAVGLSRSLDEDARRRLADLRDRARQLGLGLWGGEYADAFRTWQQK